MEYSANTDYYKLLGVPRNASPSAIRSAYRKLILIWHPDKNKDKGASEKFYEIHKAYKVLSDKAKRENYDRNLHRHNVHEQATPRWNRATPEQNVPPQNMNFSAGGRKINETLQIYIGANEHKGYIAYNGINCTITIIIKGTNIIGNIKITGVNNTTKIIIDGNNCIGDIIISGTNCTNSIDSKGKNYINDIDINGVNSYSSVKIIGDSSVGDIKISGVNCDGKIFARGIAEIGKTQIFGVNSSGHIVINGVCI